MKKYFLLFAMACTMVVYLSSCEKDEDEFTLTQTENVAIKKDEVEIPPVL